MALKKKVAVAYERFQTYDDLTEKKKVFWKSSRLLGWSFKNCHTGRRDSECISLGDRHCFVVIDLSV